MKKYNLQEIRVNISRVMREPFFDYMPDGYANPAGGALVPSFSLWDRNEMWTKGWVYVRTGTHKGKERRIASFTAPSTFTVDPAFSPALAVTDQYEVHVRTTARAKNNAINLAIEEAYPNHFNLVQTDITIPDAAEDGTRPSEINNTHGLPTDWEDLLRAWFFNTSGNKWEMIDDILPEYRGGVLYRILLPVRLQTKSGDIIRLEGMTKPLPLLYDTDTTDLPLPYLTHKAIQHLALGLGYAGPDRDWDAEQFLGRFSATEADRLLKQQRQPRPVRTIWRTGTPPQNSSVRITYSPFSD